VILGACWDDSDLACISVDNLLGVRTALEHFAQAGHRHLGLVHVESLDFTDHRERVEAFCQLTRSMGLAVSQPEGILSGTSNPEPLTKYEEYLGSLPKPVAVLVTDAHLAAKLLQAALGLDLEIPNDVAIITFDEVPREIEIPVPLSTIRQPLLEMAHRAVRRLMDALIHRQVPTGPERFATEFIHRRSCCPWPPKREGGDRRKTLKTTP